MMQSELFPPDTELAAPAPAQASLFQERDPRDAANALRDDKDHALNLITLSMSPLAGEDYAAAIAAFCMAVFLCRAGNSVYINLKGDTSENYARIIKKRLILAEQFSPFCQAVYCTNKKWRASVDHSAVSIHELPMRLSYRKQSSVAWRRTERKLMLRLDEPSYIKGMSGLTVDRSLELDHVHHWWRMLHACLSGCVHLTDFDERIEWARDLASREDKLALRLYQWRNHKCDVLRDYTDGHLGEDCDAIGLTKELAP